MMPLRRIIIVFVFISCTILLLLFGEFLIVFLYPLSHDYVQSPHPPSPHIPPSFSRLSTDQVDEYKKNGVVVIRNALPKGIIEKIQKGSTDLKTNYTLHCGMAYFNGPPILHKYHYLCQWPEKAHDYFRDALYQAPLAHIASQLLNNNPVRVLNTIIMGSPSDKTIPKRWHSDYGTFTGRGQCDNGLIMWMPVEEPSYPQANGMIVSKGSNIPHERIIENLVVGNGQWDLEKHPAFVAHFWAGYFSSSHWPFYIASLHYRAK